VARVVIAPAAVEDLDLIIETRTLPADTRARVRKALEPLGEFPLLGPALTGRWDGFRYLLGPWSWMLMVYAFDEKSDQVTVVTVQDARSARAATSGL
jgi:plasmid stabilization system protein ParE